MWGDSITYKFLPQPQLASQLHTRGARKPARKHREVLQQIWRRRLKSIRVQDDSGVLVIGKDTEQSRRETPSIARSQSAPALNVRARVPRG